MLSKVRFVSHLSFMSTAVVSRDENIVDAAMAGSVVILLYEYVQVCSSRGLYHPSRTEVYSP